MEGQSNQQHEDAALKHCMQFFADELLSYFHIEGKVTSVGPTELVHLDVRKNYEDFNLLMEDGSCKHFEFQSTNDGISDLKRFRVYEALYSFQHNVPVTTYVLYSGKIQNPVTQFTEGLNTYRVQPIIMRSKDAEEYLVSLTQKIESGEKLTKQDLVPLALFPLMGGKLSVKERIKTAFSITRRAKIEPKITEIDIEDINKIEVVIYTMAEKFLDSFDMEEIKESVSMTRLGQMLVNDGMQKGIELERVHTEEEKKRADEAEAELVELRARLAQLEALIAK